MTDPADLLKAWQHAIRDLGGVAASLASGPAGAAGDLVDLCSDSSPLVNPDNTGI